MNEYTSLQKYKPLTLYFWKGDVLLCVRDGWRQGQTSILTQVLLLTIAALLSHLGWGCSTVDHWRPCRLQAGSHFGILVSDWLTAAGTLSIFFLTQVHPVLFFLTQVHLLDDSSVEGQYITLTQVHPVLFFLTQVHLLDDSSVEGQYITLTQDKFF